MSGDNKEFYMKTDYKKEFISTEIQNLFETAENFVVKKDSMLEAIRFMYLKTSCNN